MDVLLILVIGLDLFQAKSPRGKGTEARISYLFLWHFLLQLHLDYLLNLVQLHDITVMQQWPDVHNSQQHVMVRWFLLYWDQNRY